MMASRAICVLVLMLASSAGISGCNWKISDRQTSGMETATVRTALSTNRAYIGDVVTYRIWIRHPAGASVELPDFHQGKRIRVLNHEREVRKVSQDTVETEIRFDISSFELGSHPLLTNDVVIRYPDGTAQKWTPPQDVLEVQSILDETNATVQAFTELLKWPSPISRWLWVLPLIGAVAAGVGWIATRFLSKPRTILQMPPPDPPHVVALRALRTLAAKGWIESGLVEPFYVELSDIVRRYIEGRFAIRAPELTTEEFIREAAQSHELTEAQKELVRAFLEQADLVKFARYQPGVPEMRAAFQAAERLVHETMPPLQAEPSQEKKA